MGFNFEHDLDHQRKAIEGVLGVLKNISFKSSPSPHANPALFFPQSIKKNILDIQSKNGIKANSFVPYDQQPLNLDIKMETGTGKTYTYVRTIFKLKQA